MRLFPNDSCSFNDIPECDLHPSAESAHDDAAGRVESRSKQIATLTVAARDILLSDETRRATAAAQREVERLDPASPQRRSVEQTAFAIDFHSRIPAALQKRRAELKTMANAAWIKARADSDFKQFQPYLYQAVEVARAYADAIGVLDREHPYDALMSIYEPGGETVASREIKAVRRLTRRS